MIYNSEQVLTITGLPSPVTALKFHPTQSLLAVGHVSGRVTVWSYNAFDSTTELVYELCAHVRGVTDLAWAPEAAPGLILPKANAHVLVTAGDDGAATAWCLDPPERGAGCVLLGSESAAAFFWGHDGPVMSVDVVAGGAELVTAGWDESVRVWDLRSTACVGSARALASPAVGVAGGAVLPSSFDDPRTYTALDLDGTIRTLAWTHEGLDVITTVRLPPGATARGAAAAGARLIAVVSPATETEPAVLRLIDPRAPDHTRCVLRQVLLAHRADPALLAAVATAHREGASAVTVAAGGTDAVDVVTFADETSEQRTGVAKLPGAGHVAAVSVTFVGNSLWLASGASYEHDECVVIHKLE